MIDIHLHILPGVDDGPKTIEESVALARVMVQEGIHTAIATPHYNDLFPRRPAAEIKERVHALQHVLDSHSIPLHLYSGHEALIQSGLVGDIQSGRLSTLNGSRYLLLEMWSNSWLPETERVIFELRAFGIVPIIAHPERYAAIQENPDRLHTLLQQGVLTQLTASSLLRIQGNATRKCAEVLLKKGYIQCIASDAHGTGNRLRTIKPSLEVVAQMLGQAKAHMLSVDIPAAIVQNEELSLGSTGTLRQERGMRR